MKYLKKIFEDGRNPLSQKVTYEEIRKLIDIISSYHEWLKNDKIWQDYYKDFENWRKSKNDTRGKEFLKEVIKFAEKRFEEIKIEFQNHIDFVKDLYLNYLEDCQSFSEYSIKRKSDNNLFLIELTLVFSIITLKNRKDDDGFKLISDEIMDYWKAIYDFFKVLESNEYTPKISYYQPNGVEMKITIQKRDED
mgnify:FL=1